MLRKMLGKTLRLWNVYGAEAIGLKSHVLSDWAQQCVQQVCRRVKREVVGDKDCRGMQHLALMVWRSGR
eukprot:766786-Hanusia_phi.AAC.9